MKLRVVDVMNEALGLVKKSDLGGATALIRKALSGESAPAGANDDSKAPPPRPSARVIPLAPRRSLGETLRALRVRPVLPPGLPDAPEPQPAPDLGERFLKRAYSGPAGALDYRLYVPAEPEKRALALVIMLHGCTQNPEDFALGTQMNALAEEFGLVVAYPHQPRLANAQGCWNWFDRRHQSRGSGEPAKLAGLAQALAKEFDVRRERVFAAGLSAGGAMAEILAVTYPDVFDAVGIHSGLPYKSAGDVPSAFAAMSGSAPFNPAPLAVNDRPSDRNVRRIIVHGLADGTVAPVNGERLLDEAERGETALTRSDLDWPIEGGRVSRVALKDSDGQPVAERWLVEGGGHAWFGGDPRGSFTQTVGLDASRVMVRFFLAD
ncbi:MAG TPA: PHB depolymerase family esterase [Roseiarcus sp.]|jgi:poly(hydroxyalkanoate) depolymerase family esterase